MKNYFAGFAEAVGKGDRWTRSSLLFMGAGYIGRGQIIKGILVQLIQIGFWWFTFGFSAQYIAQLMTLGTVQRQEVFDPTTMSKTVNDYDNSLLILLCGIIGIFFILAYILLFFQNTRKVYLLQKRAEAGEHINSFREDLRTLINEKFYVTLLTLPGLGVLLVNVFPILFMICVAFTNYESSAANLSFYLGRT